MKILNLFAGIGGNRTLWGDKHEITAVEHNQQIAMIYHKRFPKDKVIIGDALKYLTSHRHDFDFIWASPPCQTHGTMRVMNKKKDIPDCTSLYGLIIFLQKWTNTNCKWVVENVIPYYEALIPPTIIFHRHCYWSNYPIKNKDFERIYIAHKTVDPNGDVHVHDTTWKELCEIHNIDTIILKDLKSRQKRTVMRNFIEPEIGKYILDSIEHRKQVSLEGFMK